MNQRALTELIAIDVRAGNRDALRTNLPVLLQMRKPSRAVLEEALLRLDTPGDDALDTEIRRVISQASAQPAAGI